MTQFFTKLLSYLSLCSLFLLPACHASSLINKSKSHEGDPCNEVPGQWIGTWSSPKCLWKAEVKGSKYDNSIILIVHVRNARQRGCSDQYGVIGGTCKDGRINVEGFTGHVLNGVMILENHGFGATLRKV